MKKIKELIKKYQDEEFKEIIPDDEVKLLDTAKNDYQSFLQKLQETDKFFEYFDSGILRYNINSNVEIEVTPDEVKVLQSFQTTSKYTKQTVVLSELINSQYFKKIVKIYQSYNKVSNIITQNYYNIINKYNNIISDKIQDKNEMKKLKGRTFMYDDEICKITKVRRIKDNLTVFFTDSTGDEKYESYYYSLYMKLCISPDIQRIWDRSQKAQFLHDSL